MQYEIFDDFKDGMVMTAIPLSWYRRVTGFIKGFGGGGVVKVRTENGAPNVTMDVSISQKDNINTETKPYKDAGGARVTDSPFDGDGENTVSWGINEENENDKNGCIVTLPTRFAHPTKTEDGQQVEDKSKIRMFFRSFAKSPSGITAAITREIGYKDFCSAKLNDDSTVLEEDGDADAGSSDDVARADHIHPINVADSGAPSDVVKSTGTASLGEDDTYARTDHVHKMPELAATDISYSESTVDAKLTNHETRITALESASPQTPPVTSVNGKTGAVVLSADDVGALDDDDIGVSVQEQSDKLDDVQQYIDANGKVLLSGIQGNVSGHTGNCIVTMDDDGVLGHSGNTAYTLLDDAAEQTKGATKLITDKDLGGGLALDGDNNVSVLCKSGGGIEVDADEGLALGDGAALYDPEDIPTDAILGIGADGYLESKCDIPTTAPTTDKVLTIKKGGTDLSWEDAGSGAGEKTTPTATKGISVHAPYPLLADFYDYPDKAAHPSDPEIVFPEFQSRLDLTGEHAPPGRMTGADNTTPVGWERGKTAYKNGHDVDASHPAVGCSMTVCTHMRQVSISGTAKYQAIFSRMDFDENGLLVRVVPCSNWFTLM